MCLIVYNQGGGAKLPERNLRIAYENNPHGFGMMWADNGEVNTIRGIYTIDEILSMVRAMDGIPYVIHFRYRTRGVINKSNCHPHRVLSKKIDGHDLHMMHNGTFFFLKTDEDESDSVQFAKHLRGSLRVFGADSLFDKTQLNRMATRVGVINKLVFLRGDGKIAIVNKSEGFEKDGCWYSNTYSLKPGYRTIQKVNYEKSAAKDNENFRKDLDSYWKSTSTSTDIPAVPVQQKYSWYDTDLDSVKLAPRNQKKNKDGKKQVKNEVKPKSKLQFVKQKKIGNRSIVKVTELDLDDPKLFTH